MNTTLNIDSCYNNYKNIISMDPFMQHHYNPYQCISVIHFFTHYRLMISDNSPMRNINDILLFLFCRAYKQINIRVDLDGVTWYLSIFTGLEYLLEYLLQHAWAMFCVALLGNILSRAITQFWYLYIIMFVLLNCMSMSL